MSSEADSGILFDPTNSSYSCTICPDFANVFNDASWANKHWKSSQHACVQRLLKRKNKLKEPSDSRLPPREPGARTTPVDSLPENSTPNFYYEPELTLDPENSSNLDQERQIYQFISALRAMNADQDKESPLRESDDDFDDISDFDTAQPDDKDDPGECV